MEHTESLVKGHFDEDPDRAMTRAEWEAIAVDSAKKAARSPVSQRPQGMGAGVCLAYPTWPDGGRGIFLMAGAHGRRRIKCTAIVLPWDIGTRTHRISCIADAASSSCSNQRACHGRLLGIRVKVANIAHKYKSWGSVAGIAAPAGDGCRCVSCVSHVARRRGQHLLDGWRPRQAAD